MVYGAAIMVTNLTRAATSARRAEELAEMQFRGLAAHGAASVGIAHLQALAPGQRRIIDLMKKVLMGASAAAMVALAPLCTPPAPARADDHCVSITDPAAHQACIDGSLPKGPMRRNEGDCRASPRWGAEGQFCQNFWIRESAPPDGRRAVRTGWAPGALRVRVLQSQQTTVPTRLRLVPF
jgi:hypothetical protein